MIELFDIADVNKSASAINPDKLLWLNQHYIKNGDFGRLGGELGWHLSRIGVEVENSEKLAAVVRAQAERAKTIKDMAVASRFFFEDFSDYDPKAAAKNLNAGSLPALRDMQVRLTNLESWSAEAIHGALQDCVVALDLKLGKVAQPLRVAVSGGTVSPPIDATLEILGRETVLERIRRAMSYIESLPA